MGKSRPLSISISANQICLFSSSQSLWYRVQITIRFKFYFELKEAVHSGLWLPHFKLTKVKIILP